MTNLNDAYELDHTYDTQCPNGCGTMLNHIGEEPENLFDQGAPIEHTTVSCNAKKARQEKEYGNTAIR